MNDKATTRPETRDDSIEACLRGDSLFGDDFNDDQVAQWFQEEKEAYYKLSSTEKLEYKYSYHALNKRHGFDFLPKGVFEHVLGIGSAYGDELVPIIERCKRITILEPAPGFARSEICGVPTTYVSPDPLGTFPFESRSFDVISCFGVLHHIPNVSAVIKEIFRCLKPSGYALIREPIRSMGDWRRRRRGLTKRERGIPLHIARKIVLAAGFHIVREQRCMFSVTSRLGYVLRRPPFNSPFVVLIDELLCRLPIWSTKYHSTNAFRKMAPTSVYYVLKRP